MFETKVVSGRRVFVAPVFVAGIFVGKDCLLTTEFTETAAETAHGNHVGAGTVTTTTGPSDQDTLFFLLHDLVTPL